MKVFYSRVSTEDQNSDRQLQNTNEFDYILNDKCSGLIPIWERPKGSQIKKLIDSGKLRHLEIHNIDRLGRSTIDVLQVWKQLTELGITVVCRNPNIRNLNSEGKPDIFSDLMISILSTMSSFEKNMIKERQMEGIRIRQAKGLYTGRPVNTKQTPEKFLAKAKIKKILECLNSGYTQEDIISVCKCSYSTIAKAIKIQSSQVDLNAELNLTI
jgi:DNA invertase Pin-like site-specific DNA recombinase